MESSKSESATWEDVTAVRTLWAKVRKGIWTVFQNPKSLSMDTNLELYRDVNDICFGYMCRLRSASQESVEKERLVFLYNKIENLLENIVCRTTDNYLSSGENLVVFCINQWSNYKESSTVIRSACACLDVDWSVYLPRGKAPLYRLIVEIWRKRKFDNIQKDLADSILEMIESDRNLWENSAVIYTQIVDYYLAMGNNESDFKKLYKDYLEERFLIATEEFYNKMKVGIIGETSTAREYLDRVEILLIIETHRFRKNFEYHSGVRMWQLRRRVFHPATVDKYRDEFKQLLHKSNETALSSLLMRVRRMFESTRQFLSCFEEQVQFECMEVFKEYSKDAKSYVEKISLIIRKFEKLANKALRRDRHFKAALEPIFSRLLKNSTESGFALVVEYCNAISKDFVCDNNLKINFDELIVILKYASELEPIKKLLSKLVAQWYTSTHFANEVIVSQFEQLFNRDSAKLRGVTTEISKCQDNNYAFRRHLEETNSSISMDFSFKLLPISLWPFKTENIALKLPLELDTALTKFNDFYGKCYTPGRKIILLHKLSQGEIQLNVSGKECIFQVDTLQIAVLLLFNSADTLTVRQIQEKTGLDEDNLFKTIRALLNENVLKTSTDGTDLILDSTVEVVLTRTNKRRRVNLTTMENPKLQEDLKTPVPSHLKYDRTDAIQAAIVGFMKREKILNLSELIRLIRDKLSKTFVPKIYDIHSNIEVLVKKGYIEKTIAEEITYKYVP